MTLRRLFFWLHLSIGLVVGLLIAFLALTGAIISFQTQLVAFAERHLRADHLASTACVLPSTLLANAAAASPKPLTSLTVFADPRQPAQIMIGSDGAVLLADSCTGQILGPGASHLRVFLTSVRELHHQATFAGVRHETLRALKNAAALAFVFMILSGLFLWFPRRLTWQHLRPSVLFRPGLRGRAREGNLHNLAGFWLCLPLLAIATTGVIMAYPWANTLLFRAAGEAPPAPRREGPPVRSAGHDNAPHQHRPQDAETRGPSSAFTELDTPIAHALAFTPGISSVSLRLPTGGDTKALTLQLTRFDRQPVLRDTLTLTPGDARVLKWEPLAAATRGRHWRTVVRFLHTGELFGAPGQTVALTAALGALLLVWTGISLALRRLAAFRRRRNQPHPTSATAPEARQPLQVS